ncbi:hypothetical protein ACFL21_05240 [Patescibacteria group bacterium]
MKTLINLFIIVILIFLSGCSENTPSSNKINTETQPTYEKSNTQLIPDDTIINNSQTIKRESNTQLSEEEQYCVDKGGRVGKIKECDDMISVCTLKDGTDCPLDEFFKGYCEEGVLVEWGEACRGE